MKYFHGIISKGEEINFGSIGFPLADFETKFGNVFTVPYENMGAVVSDIDDMDFQTPDKEMLVRRLLVHQKVLEHVVKEGCGILPVKFGTCLNDVDEALKVMKIGYFKFEDASRRMGKKHELDLVVTWDTNKKLKEVALESQEIQHFKQKIEKMPESKSAAEKMKIGMMLQKELHHVRDGISREILSTLVDITKSRSDHELMDDNMVINSSFLLNDMEEKTFDKILAGLDSRFNGELNFKCLTPLPPYSFATVEIKTIEFEEIEKAWNLFDFGKKTTLNEIKEVNRKLTKEWHPDKRPGDHEAQIKFEGLNTSYKTLLDYCESGKASLPKKGEKFFKVNVVKAEEML